MTEALQQEIRTLRSLLHSDRDPEGRVFAPLADAHRRAREVPEAMVLLKEGLARHPEFVPGHVVAAQIYLEQGLAVEAGIAARRALDLDAENVHALRSLLRVLEEKGDLPDAEDIRSRLVTLEPDFLEEATAADTVLRGAWGAGPEAASAESVDAIDAGEPDAEPAVVEDSFGLDSLGLDSLGLDSLALVPELDDVEDAIGSEALTADEEPVTAEDVFDLDSLAPAAWGAAVEDEIDVASLAPDEEPTEEIVSLASLAPDEEPAEEIVSLASLAPDEESAEEIVSLASLAPDEEPVFELDVLGPGTAAAAVEDAIEFNSPVVHAEAMSAEPVFDLDALGPHGADPVGIGSLAPESPGDDPGVRHSEGVEPGVDDEPAGLGQNGQPVYTRTLAELYVEQGAIGEALVVFRHLQRGDPTDSEIARRIEVLEAGSALSDAEIHGAWGGEAGQMLEEETEALARDLAESGHGEHDVHTPFAWTDEEKEATGSGGPTIREYFDGLLNWERGEEP